MAFLMILEIHDVEKVKDYCSEATAGVHNTYWLKLESFSFDKMCQDSEVPYDKHSKAEGRGGCHSLLILGAFQFTVSGITFSLPMTQHISGSNI